jgi:predicted NBD/HSP70 family sugar kinase
LETVLRVSEYISQLKLVSHVKKANLSAIMQILLSEGLNSRATIARATKLSPPTISRLIKELVGYGIVTIEGPSQNGDPGAPPSMLKLNAELGHVIGIDVGETVTQFAVSDLRGAIEGRLDLPTKGRVGGDVTLGQIVQGCEQLLVESAIPKDSFWSVCIGIPGIIDELGQVNAPDIAGWWKFPLRERLKGSIISELVLEKSINLAVVGECEDGCARGYKNVAFISIRAGIGAGLIIGGRLFRGANGAAGEIGFMLTDIDAVPPDNRGHGALEMQVGFDPLLRMLGPRAQDLDNVEGVINLETLFAKAAQGDEDFLNVVDFASRYYAQAIANLVTVLNPDLVVIGGDVCPAGDRVLDAIREKVVSFFPYPPQIKLTSLGAQAALHGALRVALRAAHARLGITPILSGQ